MKILILVLTFFSLQNYAVASKTIHLSDIVSNSKPELCRAECDATQALLTEKIQKQTDADRSHLDGQLKVWKKSCLKICQTLIK